MGYDCATLKQAREVAFVTPPRDDSRHPSNLANSEIKDGFFLAAKIAPVMIWMTDRNALCVYVNEGWVRFTGRPFETQLVNGWMETVHPDDLTSMRSTYLAACHQRVPFQMTYRARQYDGEYRWILDSGVPRFDEEGSFAGYVGSCVDITDRKHAEDALNSLSGQLIKAQEEERARIAREIHDDYQQRLALISIDLDDLARHLEENSEERDRLNKLSKRIGELDSDLRSLSHRLHSDTLDFLGLVAALESLSAEFRDYHSTDVHFVMKSVPSATPREVALCLFRIAQEALQNIKKHSHADSADVRLEQLEEKLHLSISDDGAGFDQEGPSRKVGIGIRSMEERVRLVGGQFAIRSRPMEGTKIDVWVPIGRPAIADYSQNAVSNDE